MILEYKQPIKIGDKIQELNRKESFGEDCLWHRFKFVMFIIGCMLTLLGVWTHGFGFFGGEQQVNRRSVVPSMTFNVPPSTVVAPVVVQSLVPVTSTPVARPSVQSAPRPIPKAVSPVPAPEVPKPEPPPRPAPTVPKSLWELKQNQ